MPCPDEPFLPAEEWQYIQDFNRAMADMQMDICLRCWERWFNMKLKDGVCQQCYLRDINPHSRKQVLSPFLMSIDNKMDPGDLPVSLPALMQVEEMVITRAHVQMLLKRVCGHQYQYTGHCVSFMQNIIKTVDVLPLLLSELDIVLLQLSKSVMGHDSRYQRQFQANFRVRRGCVLTWLHFLKTHHPDYWHITISPMWIEALPIDDDVLPFITMLFEDDLSEEWPRLETNPDLGGPPASQSMVPNLAPDSTEVNLILAGLG